MFRDANFMSDSEPWLANLFTGLFSPQGNQCGNMTFCDFAWRQTSHSVYTRIDCFYEQLKLVDKKKRQFVLQMPIYNIFKDLMLRCAKAAIASLWGV